MREILSFVRRIAVSETATILLDGENGTGKDLIARTIHDQSRRQAKPFIAVNWRNWHSHSRYVARK